MHKANDKNLNLAANQGKESTTETREWRSGVYAPVFYTDEELYEQSVGTLASAGDLFWTYYRMMVAVRA